MTDKDVYSGSKRKFGLDSATINQRDLDDIKIQDIGISTVRQFATMPLDTEERKYIDNCKRWLAHQAIVDGIAPYVDALSFRPILPDLDFYERYNGPAPREWIQHLYGSDDYFEIYHNYKYAWPASPGGEKKLITTNKSSCMIIFGIQDLTPNELITDGKPLFVNGLRFKRANIKVVGIEDISHIRTAKNRAVLFETAYLYKKNDMLAIDFHVARDAAFNTANLALLGMVAEPLGAEQLG